MAHEDREILGEVSIECCQHGVRGQLEEWNFMIGQPQRHPALIGKTQVPTAMHGVFQGT